MNSLNISDLNGLNLTPEQGSALARIRESLTKWARRTEQPVQLVALALLDRKGAPHQAVRAANSEQNTLLRLRRRWA